MNVKFFVNAMMSFALFVGLAAPPALAEMASVGGAELERAQDGSMQFSQGADAAASEDFLRPYPPPRPRPPRPQPPRPPRPYPRPQPPRPYPVPQNICSGAYSGSFSNGVPGVLFINGYSASINLNGFVFSGSFDCRPDGYGGAYIYYQLACPSIPGFVQGQGSITFGHDGRAYLQATQNNGLIFNAVR